MPRVTAPTAVRLLLSRLLVLFGTALAIARGEEDPKNLRPQSDLTSNCFDFPANNFDRTRSIRGVHAESPALLLSNGEGAIDFTLHDLYGRAWNLHDALRLGGGKPVVLMWGMYTCPAFQGMGTSPPWDKCGYRDQYDLVSVACFAYSSISIG